VLVEKNWHYRGGKVLVKKCLRGKSLKCKRSRIILGKSMSGKGEGSRVASHWVGGKKTSSNWITSSVRKKRKREENIASREDFIESYRNP